MRIYAVFGIACFLVMCAGPPSPPRLGMTPGAAWVAFCMAMPPLSGVAFGLGHRTLGTLMFLPAIPLSLLIGVIFLSPAVLLGFAAVAVVVGAVTVVVRDHVEEARQAAARRRGKRGEPGGDVAGDPGAPP